MINQINALFMSAMGLLIPALVLIVIELLRRQLGLEKIRKFQVELQTKQELANIAIKMVEQVYKDLHGEEKYEQAAHWLADRAADKGLKVSEDEIKGLIESAVRMAKDEFGEQWAKQADK